MRITPTPDVTLGTADTRIAVRSVRLPADDPRSRAPLLSLIPQRDSVVWIRGEEGLVGWGEAARGDFAGPERFSRAMQWWQQWVAGAQVSDEVRLGGSGPVAFGSFAFDQAPGRSVVVVPAVVVGRRAGVTWITTVGGAGAEFPAAGPPAAPASVHWRQGTLPESQWASAVSAVVARIESGELDKVVLARDLWADIGGGLDERYLLEQLHLDYPQCWTFHVAGLIGATPELLVRREGNRVTSRVLAGTVGRSVSGDAPSDDAAAAALLASDKDLNEHSYAVASVADALAAHCADLHLPPRPAVLRLANVQHLSTEITATVVDGVSALALAASLHPTAAVCGTPTERARAIIRSVERMDRGRYAGPVGWVDQNGDGEFGIALRCGEIDHDHDQVRVFAGCGLVAGSDPAAELAESAAKFAAMRSALEPTAPGP